LNSHMNISSNGEIFSVKVRRANASTIIENLDKLYNLDWFSSASKNECTAAVGLKWMLNQVSGICNLSLLVFNLRNCCKSFGGNSALGICCVHFHHWGVTTIIHSLSNRDATLPDDT